MAEMHDSTRLMLGAFADGNMTTGSQQAFVADWREAGCPDSPPPWLQF